MDQYFTRHQHSENIFGLKNIQHIVSNGFCSDTVSEIINLDNLLTAAFKAPDKVCPKGIIAFNNISVGNIISYYWDFGDGTSSTEQVPSDHTFPETRQGITYRVKLIVQDNLGCQDTALSEITKLQSCYITVPNAFTPNGDGKNDWLYPLNTFQVSNFEFQVFNRFGQLVFESRDPSKKWDGTINGHPQESGTYIWMLITQMMPEKNVPERFHDITQVTRKEGREKIPHKPGGLKAIVVGTIFDFL
jgi:gliding motility-associated-like protein